jgi:hypothetical protein
MARKRLGELLLERRVITPAQLDQALAYQRQTGHRLGIAMLALGFMSEQQLVEALAQALGLKAVKMPPDQIDWDALQTLRSRFCEANDLFPLTVEELTLGRRRLAVAMADPLNVPAIEEIEFTTGMVVQAVIAPLSGIRAAIRKHYLKQAEVAADAPMTIVHSGGVEHHVTGHEELPELPADAMQEVTERTALADLIRERMERKRKKRPVSTAADADLNYLFGMKADSSDARVEKLEHRFWTLLRIMAKKGLITRDEFLHELADED